MSAPLFPNVPFAQGVPSLARVKGVIADRIAGEVQGVVNRATGNFTGSVQGIISQATGRSGLLSGALAGVMDADNRVSAVLSGELGGAILGQVTGAFDAVSGVFSGALAGTATNVRGVIPEVGDDASSELATAADFQWGIFDDDNNPIVVGDAVLAVDYVQDYRISSYPIEGGSFSNYNKVEIPFDIRLTFTQSAGLLEKAAFLRDIQQAIASTNLYNVATPEMTYLGVNVVHQSMRRTAQSGADMLTVDVGCQQVRDTAEVAFTQTKTDAGAATVNVGPVQPKTPTPTQSSTLTGVE